MTPVLVWLLIVMSVLGIGALGGSLLMRDRTAGKDLIGPMAVVVGLILVVARGSGAPFGLEELMGLAGLVGIVGGSIWSLVRLRRLERARRDERQRLEASGVPEGAMEILRLEDRLDDVRIRAPHVGGFGLTLLVAGPVVGMAALSGGPGPWIAAAITASVPVAAGWGLWRRFREARQLRAEIEARLESPPEGPPNRP